LKGVNSLQCRKMEKRAGMSRLLACNSSVFQDNEFITYGTS
jgi:hypothetical protein